jgi:Tol biopolymer transport system component
MARTRMSTVTALVVLVSTAVAASASATHHPRHADVPGQTAHRPANGRVSFGTPDPSVGDVTLWTARVDGTHRRRLTREPSFFSDWSPDGLQIAYDFLDRLGREHIATIRPNGGHRRQITFGAGIQEVPKWSPNGRWITFDASPVSGDDPSFSTSIWIMRPDGSHQRRVTRAGFDIEPVFSGDGSKVAFGRITGGNANGEQLEAVYVVNAHGTHLRRVVAPRAGLEHPDWSPDGRWITFNIEPQTAGTPTAGAILAVHPNGRRLHILRRATAHLGFFKAVWSPDGRKLLSGCHDARDGLDKLCVIDAAGGRAWITLSRSPFPVNFPAWGTRAAARG